MAGPSAPWQADIDKSQIVDLNALWLKWNQPAQVSQVTNHYWENEQVQVSPEEVAALLGQALTERKEWLEHKDTQPGPDPRRKLSTSERIDAAIIEHLAATDAYAVAVELSATLDAESKRRAARKYLEVKANVPEGAKRVTDTEANRAVDADETVLEGRLSADIAAAQAKAAKARLDHWEHVINWGRSVYSRESKADTR
jgi:hypothetical protein